MGLVDSFNDAFNKGVSGTERLLEIGKLKTKIANLGKARSDLLTALGAVAYEQYRTSTGSVEAFATLGERIRAVELETAQAQSRLDELEAGAAAHTIRCSACGHENQIGARFCVKCGAAVEAEPTGTLCASCGARLPEDGRFCVRCGTPAAPPSEDVEESGLEAEGTS